MRALRNVGGPPGERAQWAPPAPSAMCWRARPCGVELGRPHLAAPRSAGTCVLVHVSACVSRPCVREP